MTSVSGVEVVNWNPRTRRIPALGWNVGRRVNNFGDLIGPLVVAKMTNQFPADSRPQFSPHRLLTVGSIMHLARTGDIVWGSGVNGKVSIAEHAYSSLDVRAVRGPLTKAWLHTHKRVEAPEVFGDPALLFPELFRTEIVHPSALSRSMTLIPNLNDLPRFRDHPSLISPVGTPSSIIRTIISSEFVVGSSLHAIILADAYGVPAALISSTHEHPLKYQDYVEGARREPLREFSTVEDAERAMRSWAPTAPRALSAWNPQPLIDSFPADAWRRRL